ncbi:ABC transporter substrate-binding protein [Azospirillum halopraeferens]|uniref:ABC transporter substrate-binding protein n=1 Tax=Azospirillum halopraeferens TaxID=34010 RepID=UPI00041ECE11|nr:ABC transporter substrate-binding protein [Azospirillum halopraeferens]
MKTTFAATAAVIALLQAGAAQAQDTIRIGVTQPLTGAVAASGTYITNGARIAEAMINERGGVLGKSIELVIEDNKSNPKEAVTTAEKLILRDKVPVLIGAWSSTFTLAIMPKLMEYKVPMVVETSSSGKITTAGNPWVFRIAPTSAMEAKAFADKLDRFDPPITKVDFLSVNNDFGLGATQAFRKELEARGIKAGVVETMTPEATDLSAQLTRIRQSGGDTVIVTSGVEQITLAVKQAAEQGLKARLLSTGGSFPGELMQPNAPGNGSYHLLFFPPWFPENATHPDVAEAFVNAWKARGYEFAGLTEGFRGYDAVLTVADAITRAGKAEPEAIRAALWETGVKGVNGDIAFVKEGPEGQESGQNIPNVYVVHLKDGQVSMP